MPHPVTWFEVHTPDPDRAQSFYGDLFGWSFTPHEAPGYTLIDLGEDAPIGGGIASPGPETRPMAVFNVQVPDVAAICARVEAAGGKVAVATQTSPDGLVFAYLTDPDGNMLGVWTPPPPAA